MLYILIAITLFGLALLTTSFTFEDKVPYDREGSGSGCLMFFFSLPLYFGGGFALHYYFGFLGRLSPIWVGIVLIIIVFIFSISSSGEEKK